MSKRDDIQGALSDVISAMMIGASAEIQKSDSFKKIIEHPAILENPTLLFLKM